MVFLRLFPARPQGVPYGAADAIDMPYRFFFAFVYAMAFLDIAASSVLPVFAGQPVIAPDAVSQAIVFQIVGITPADREQIRLQQLKQRLVSHRDVNTSSREEIASAAGWDVIGRR